MSEREIELIACPTCGNTVDAIKSCAHCGQVNPAQAGPDGVVFADRVSAPSLRTLLFGFEGRVSASYFVALWVASMAGLFALVLFSYALPEDVGAFIGLAYMGTVLWIGLATTVKRLHDIDRSAAILLLYFVPIVGFFAFLYVGLGTGTPGPNRHGDHTYTASDLFSR